MSPVQKMISLMFVTLVPTLSFAAYESGYVSLPSAEQRANSGSGYFVVTDFPTVYLVEEGTGLPNADAVSYIRDAVVRADLEDHKFKSLQVRELAIRPNHKMVANDTVSLPFAASLKHDRRGSMATQFFRRGTLDVAGTLEIRNDGSRLSVQVSRFDDSQFLEWAGRKVGTVSLVDLEFARAVVPAGIESFYNSDPRRIEALLSALDVASTRP